MSQLIKECFQESPLWCMTVAMIIPVMIGYAYLLTKELISRAK